MATFATRKNGAAARAETIARRQARARKSSTTVTKGGRTVVTTKRKGF